MRKKRYKSLRKKCKYKNKSFLRIKSTEEILLEEIAKHKFSAQPIKKNLFSSKSSSNLPVPQVVEIKEKVDSLNQIFKSVNILNSNNIFQEKDNKIVCNSGISSNFSNNPSIPKLASDKENLNISHTQSCLLKKINHTKNSNVNLSTIKISSGAETCPNLNTNYNIDKLSNLSYFSSANANSQSHGQFKARSIPQYTYREVKKSTHILTIPVSPKLRTTARSQKKVKN